MKSLPIKKLSFRAVKKAQRGAALIIALLIVAIVVLVSTAVSSDFFVLFKKVENQLHSQQAYAYLYGAEGIARQVLLQDTENSNDFDHASEGWLNVETPFANEQMQYVGKITDLQSRLYLPALLGTPTKKIKRSEDAKQTATDVERIFIRLLQTLDLEEQIDEQQAFELTNAIIDWQDEANTLLGNFDSESIPGGVEDYSDMQPPYKPANRPMIELSELRWVKGINSEIYNQLREHVTVWGTTELNVNTATPNLLRSINKNSSFAPLPEDDADVQTIIEQQQADKSGYKDKSLAYSNKGYNISKLTVKSEYFLLKGMVRFMGREYTLYSVLHRSANDVKVVARSKKPI